MENLFELYYQTSGVCTDTRKIKKDCLFICLSGANFNGNTFAEKAIELGAKYVIVDELHIENGKTIFHVPNTLVFLQKLANFHRLKFNIPVIGITGSNGKTSSKELINCVLSKKYKTLATFGNLNNHIGVPLTLLEINETHEVAIIEMGANKLKDIEELCNIAEPSHGIITNIGKAHLQGFINFEGVLKTKTELYNAVNLKKGTIFFNCDDNTLSKNIPQNCNIFSFGTDNQADVTGELIELNPFVNLKWKSKDYQSESVQTNMIGKYNFYNFLAAISFGVYFSVPNEEINDAIKSYTPQNNRSQIQRTQKNILILDAYNANPSSMQSALESFELIENPRKLTILGDMFELGEESSLEHEKIINYLIKSQQEAILIGERFYEHCTDKTSSLKFYKTKDLFRNSDAINEIKDKLILIKGSRGIGLEDLVEKL